MFSTKLKFFIKVTILFKSIKFAPFVSFSVDIVLSHNVFA